jgi:hypothetical protein
MAGVLGLEGAPVAIRRLAGINLKNFLTARNEADRELKSNAWCEVNIEIPRGLWTDLFTVLINAVSMTHIISEMR